MWGSTSRLLLGRSLPTLGLTAGRGLGALVLLGGSSTSNIPTQCHGEDSSSSAAAAACGCRRRKDDLESFLKREQKQVDWEALPVYTSQQVAQHDGTIQTSVWMSYGGFVYDVSSFIPLHPGGTARIQRAAGAAMEPFWHLHTQHFRTQEPTQILSQLVVGRLDDADQAKIDEQIDELERKLDSFHLACRVGNGRIVRYSMEELQKFVKTDRTTRVGCESKGGSLQTSLFGGVLLRELIRTMGIRHLSDYELVLQAMDGEVVKFDLSEEEISVDEILLAYEENGAPLSQGRGFPLRVIIPGKRVVKWVDRIELKAGKDVAGSNFITKWFGSIWINTRT